MATHDENPQDPTTGPLLIKGNQLQNAPEFSANIMGNYEVDLSDAGMLNFIMDISYQDDVYFSPYADKSVAMPAHTLVNARVTWSDINDNWSVALWVKNLTDKKIKTYAFDLREDFGILENMRGMPRTFGAEVAYRF